LDRQLLAEVVAGAVGAGGTELAGGDHVVGGSAAGAAGHLALVEVAGGLALGDLVTSGIAGPQPAEAIGPRGASRGGQADGVAGVIGAREDDLHAADADFGGLLNAVVVLVAEDDAAQLDR